MDILFQNTTSYSLKEYKNFIEFHGSKYNLKYNLYTLIILVALVFCMVLQFCYANIGLGILFIIALGIFLFYRVFHPLFFIKKEASSKKITNKMTNTYTFYNDFLQITNGKSSVELKYRKLYRIYETKDKFYLYLDKTHSYLLDKNNFTIGNPLEFYSFIKGKLWIRF